MIGVLECEKVRIDAREARARLGQYSDDISPELSARTLACESVLRGAARVSYSYLTLPVSYSDGCAVSIGDITLHSRDLCRALRGADFASVFAVTLGAGVDRLLARQSRISQSDHFITDALASAMAEGAADAVCDLILSGAPSVVRFSPGYGDLSIDVQPLVLKLLQAEKIGITLTHSGLMVPTKTITAIFGIEVRK